MRKRISFLIILGLFSLVGCSDEDLPPLDEELEIPDDTFAFYLIECTHDYMDLQNLSADSIVSFKSIIIGYEDIKCYDTLNHIFEVTPSAIENFDSLYFARYARHFPIAVISEKELLFAVYISHGACSSIANWYKLDYYYTQPFPNNYLVFCLPPLMDEPVYPDLRMNSRMLELFKRDNKIKN